MARSILPFCRRCAPRWSSGSQPKKHVDFGKVTLQGTKISHFLKRKINFKMWVPSRAVCVSSLQELEVVFFQLRLVDFCHPDSWGNDPIWLEHLLFKWIGSITNYIDPLPETNIALKMGHPKRKVVFQPAIFDGEPLVSDLPRNSHRSPAKFTIDTLL